MKDLDHLLLGVDEDDGRDQSGVRMASSRPGVAVIRPSPLSGASLGESDIESMQRMTSE